MLEHDLHPQPGYPFRLALTIEYALTDEGLSVSTTATNTGPDPCPYGCGFHPYLTLGTPYGRLARPARLRRERS